MKNSSNTFTIILSVTTGVFVSFGLGIQEDDKPAEKPTVVETVADEPAKIVFAPVDNMHHFMEYICEPSYKALKNSLAKKPENKSDWKAIKNHALVLAETSALVAARAPEENAQEWKEIAKTVYDSGSALYQSARKMKYDEAKTNYEEMITNCNKCHNDFANGKHLQKKW